MTIRASFPEPRTGLLGALDRFLGPGTTNAEATLILAGAVLLPLAVAFEGSGKNLPWSALEWALALLLAFDIGGGVVTNATASAKRWYHRAGQGFRQHFGFVAAHGIHLLLIAWLFREADWGYFAVMFALLVVSALALLRVPLYLQRPLALLLVGIATVAELSFLGPTLGLPWFGTLLFIKLLVSHLVYETAFRPDDQPHS
jgi:hypothetical protein